MAKWTTSLFLILTLGASVLSGMPLHSNEEKCSMHGMNGMHCCKTAQGHGDEIEVASARLCCVVNCTQSGTSGPSGVQLPKTLSLLYAAVHPAAVLPSTPAPIPVLVCRWAHSPPESSNPAYIRNLALLI